MRHLVLTLAVVFLGCLAIPTNVNADDVGEYIDRGNALHAQGQYDQAIEVYNLLLQNIDPNDTANMAIAYNNRGNSWHAKAEYDRAIADYNQALVLNPNYAEAYDNRASAWCNKNEYDKAIADDNQALTLNPNLANAYSNRGSVWHGKGEYDKAIADFNQALAINPNVKNSYRNRADAWEKKGQHDKAVADYNQALSVNPNDDAAYNSLAWLYATCPDEKYRNGKKAFEYAYKAFQLSEGKNWAYVDTLAAAYAETGDFEQAKEWEAKAIALAATDKSASDKDRQDLLSYLELYKQGKPCRDVANPQ